MSIDIWQSTGSTDFADTDNWSLNSIPADTYVVILTNNSNDIDTNLDWAGSGLVTLARLNTDKSYTGGVGTATEYLQIGSTAFNLGLPANGLSFQGSGRMNIYAANSGAIFNIFGSSSNATDLGMTPIRILGTNLVVNCTGGTIGICAGVATETASVTTLDLAQVSGGTVPVVVLGGGCALTTGNVFAGTLTNQSTTSSTVTVLGSGTLLHQGSGGYSTLTLGKQTNCNYSGTGNIGTLNCTGTADFSGGTGAVTVTNCNLYPGATINDPLGRVTFTNPIHLVQCTLEDVTLVLGYDKYIQVS